MTPEEALKWAQKAHGTGDKAYRRKDYGRALELFNEALRLQPDHLSAQEMLGSTLLRLERFEDSLALFETLRQLGHDCPSSWEDTWLAFLGLGVSANQRHVRHPLGWVGSPARTCWTRPRLWPPK